MSSQSSSVPGSPQRPFVHLHLHTQYSLLDGGIRIPDLMKRCVDLNQSAVAITDHGVMFGAAQFTKAAKKQDIKPIIGCECYLLAEGSNTDKETKVKANHITLLARNDEGYRNLCKLVTEAYINGFYYKPRIDMALLRENAAGLICLTGCLNGVLNSQILAGRLDKAEETARTLRDIFTEERIFVELQNHGLDEQKQVLEPLYDIAQKLGLPIVATNDCHYLSADDWEAHDALLCIGTGKLVKDANRMRYTSHEYYVKSGEEMAKIFTGKYAEALDNTLRVAELCDFKMSFGEYKLPVYAVPEGETIDSHFEVVARAGFDEKLTVIRATIAGGKVEADEAGYRARLDFELDIIKRMGFSGYFLIVWDFIRFAKQNGIPVGPGRGSGAGSLVAWVMGITGLDPLRYSLLFERFLNPERISMPDFDIDFCMRRRGEVIDYVTKRYGRKNVSQIITFGTLGARNAIRDVGRVLDLTYGEVDRIAKMVPEELGITLDKALDDAQELRELYDSDPMVHHVIDIARRLEGLTRHASTHAAGVVIAPKPLLNFCALYKSNKDEITTQFDMNDVESIGLIKMDFLGLRTLTVLQDAVDAIKRDTGTAIDLDALPMDDTEAYALLGSGKTCGIFQFESRGMRELIIRYKPERLEDLSALNALYRPGPIQGGLLDDFVERKHGRKKVEYLHPDVEKITEETYGVILYQEQVMQIASKVAGFSLGEADILRRAMGKKKKELMEQQKEKFLAGAAARKVNQKKAAEIFDYIDKFSGYGFNKSHSTAYGYIAYQTAWLKAHYPQHFMAALMSSEMEDSDRIKLYIAECRDLGITILPPDVNRSDVYFVVEDAAIRFSFCAIKNVGENAARAIIAARAEGPFRSIFDFCERVDLRPLNKRALESMVKAGCFDTLHASRAQVVATLDRAYELGQKASRDRESGQESLFGMVADEAQSNADESLTSVPDWSERERLGYEKEIFGFFFSGHPLSEFAEILASVCTLKADAASEAKSNQTMAGLITNLRKRQTRDGKMMATFALEDETGIIETIVFPDLFAASFRFLADDALVVVDGSIKREADSHRFIATALTPLSEHKGLERKSVQLTLDLGKVRGHEMEDLIEVIKSHRGDIPMTIRLRRDGMDVETSMKGVGVSLSNAMIARLQEIAGKDNVLINRQRSHLSF